MSYAHSFDGRIDRFGVGRERKVWYTVLFLPRDLETELPFADHPRLRVEGEIADMPVEGAWMPTGDGRRYFIVARRILEEVDVGIGDTVEMRFSVADQHAVSVPDELAATLRHYWAAQAWEALTPGKQRGFAHRVAAAKAIETRRRRVDEVLAALRLAPAD
jgi:hypothetical protein